MRIAAAATILALLLAGCASERRTQPDQTATEQLLITSAVDRVMDRLEPSLAEGTAVWVDGEDRKDFAERYVIGAIEDRLLRSGAHLVDTRDRAEVVVKARIGALSIDQEKSLFGIPGYDLPVPFASTPLSLPEIAFYGRDEQRGTAKIAVTAYDAEGGRARHVEAPLYGFAHKTESTALLFFTWTTDDLIPEPVKRREDGWLDTGLGFGAEPAAGSKGGEEGGDINGHQPAQNLPF